MRRFSIITATLFALLLGATSAQAEVKLAFVDMQRALLQVKDGKAAKARLEKMKAEREAAFKKEQNIVKGLQEAFMKQKDFMKPEVRQQKMQEIQQKGMQLQQTFAKLQRELAEEESKVTQVIFARMSRILAKMGKAQGLTMVFEKTESSILWAPSSLDLTNEVIRRYDAGEGRAAKK